MSVISVDAREVLAQLNEMGYRSISAEQLKEFIRDLKKLIKYENKIGAVSGNDKSKNESDLFAKLHETATTSSRAKHAEDAKNVKSKINLTPRKVKPQTTTLIENVPRRETPIPLANTVGSERPKTPKSSRRSKSNPTLDQKERRMWIRPRTAPAQPHRNKDPVQLYHYYQKEWERFKDRLPGENDHSDLRWQIRHKLMGNGS